ncbi:cob(I)yrinic acid a,c-diamide adenosyltransferase [Candidatus Uhrbacteria bacterium]|nr:cob(I)yrinic acid a,c-diamide adenosyltransferase [Candidatus Uhrbacteria bacterium]
MSQKPLLDERIRGRQGFGLVSVFTGDGKGKTTAALGTMVRAAGAGKKVAVVYFDKGGEHYSERSLLGRLGIDWYATGRDRIDPVTGRFDFSITEEDRQEARRGLTRLWEWIKSDGYDLAVADEINSTVALGMLDENEVLTAIKKKPERLELILTGRNAPASFRDAGHLVSVMGLEKHYFYSGVPAREGIDY